MKLVLEMQVARILLFGYMFYHVYLHHEQVNMPPSLIKFGSDFNFLPQYSSSTNLYNASDHHYSFLYWIIYP